MRSILVRNMPQAIYQRIKRKAQQENVSLSQEVVSLVLFALSEREKKDIEEFERRKEDGDVFERMKALKEEIQAKYGHKKQEPAWKMIRRMRDERSGRYE